MEEQTQKSENLLDLEKYRLKLKLRDAGVEWREDKSGKFKMWLRLAQAETPAYNR